MRRRLVSFALAAALAGGGLAGCDRASTKAAAPSPTEVLAEATGYYCGMLLVDHEGPKGQIHLAGRDEPVWFSSVRDTIAFLRLPEEPRDITAVYVNDMGRSKDWAQPDAGAWVDARQAWFVLDSERHGGMGAPEAVPFADRSAAQSFQSRYGGQLARLDEIPDAYVLGPVAAAGDAQHAQREQASPGSSASDPQRPAPHSTGGH